VSNDFNTKICPSPEFKRAIKRRNTLRKDGKTVVLTNGVFDLLHRGHIYCLWSAVQKCSKLLRKNTESIALFVAVNGDESVRRLKGPTRPVQPSGDRAYALAALGFVHTVFVFDTPRLDQEIRALKPDIYVKAGDYTLDKLDPDERAALQDTGAQIEFMPFLKGYSTTELIKRIAAAAKAGAM
jgi:rfaE bifunctional protein nucleotidyltransferase chain/domain